MYTSTLAGKIVNSEIKYICTFIGTWLLVMFLHVCLFTGGGGVYPWSLVPYPFPGGEVHLVSDPIFFPRGVFGLVPCPFQEEGVPQSGL